MVKPHHLNGRIHIAVIGGNGFIGRHLIHRLANQPNLRIWSLDKREHNITLNMKDTQAIIHDVQFDVSIDGAIQGWLIAHNIDFIIYCAGYESPTDGLHPNFVQETNALNALAKTVNGLRETTKDKDAVPHFIYLSSNSVYGFNKKKKSTEEDTLIPANYSGMLKMTAEDLIRRMCTKLEVGYSILRLPEVYGRRHHKELTNVGFWPGYLAYYVDQYIRREESIDVFSPNTSIDLVNVNYVTKVIVDCMANRTIGTFNVSSGQSIKLINLAKRVGDVFEEEYKKPHQSVINKTDRLTIEDLTTDATKMLSLVPYDFESYDLDKFLPAYFKVRRFEIAKGMAVEQILNQKYTIDTTAYGAKELYRVRQKERLLNVIRIKEIAGDQFEHIQYGRFQERARLLLEGKENRLRIGSELDKIEAHEELRVKALESTNLKELTASVKPKKISKRKTKKSEISTGS